MGYLKNLMERTRQKGEPRATKAPPGQTPTPFSDVPTTVDSGVTERLAALYSSAFGSQANETPIVAVPVNPQPGGGSGGGGISLGKIALLGALGVGGYFLYKRYAA